LPRLKPQRGAPGTAGRRVSGRLEAFALPRALDLVGAAVRTAPRDGAAKGIRVKRGNLG